MKPTDTCPQCGYGTVYFSEGDNIFVPDQLICDFCGHEHEYEEEEEDDERIS
jgi:uncharacterized protein (DUF983 family)